MLTFNKIKEMRAGYKQLEEAALLNDGIVYGGYILTEFMKDLAVTKFKKNHMSCYQEMFTTLFWDSNYNPETADRLLLPNDLDVAFKTERNKEAFIRMVMELRFFNVTEGESNDLYTSHGIGVKHTKYCISAKVGASFANTGVKLMFYVDVCVSNCEPPFNRCDTLANCFIKELEGVRISRSSGFFPPTVRPVEMVFNAGKIVNLIREKKTMITINPFSIEEAKRILYRISKAVLKGFTLTNVTWISICEEEKTCMICWNDRATHSIKQGSHFHKDCLAEFLNNAEVHQDDRCYFFYSLVREKCFVRFAMDWVFTGDW